MSKFKLLSRSALGALAASAGGGDEGPAPGEGGTDAPATPAPAPAPAPAEDDDGTEAEAVVKAADAKALMVEAEAKGFARANARMTTVFASDEGKANASLAAFLLATSSADADGIIGHLKAQGPAAAAPAAAAPVTPKPDPIPDTKVDIGVDLASLAADQGEAAKANTVVDNALVAVHGEQAITAASKAAQITTPGATTRTGN